MTRLLPKPAGIYSWPAVAAGVYLADHVLPNRAWVVYVALAVGLYLAEYADARATSRERVLSEGVPAEGVTTSRWRDLGTWAGFVVFVVPNVESLRSSELGTGDHEVAQAKLTGAAVILAIFALRYLACRVHRAFADWWLRTMTRFANTLIDLVRRYDTNPGRVDPPAIPGGVRPGAGPEPPN
ncbi:hypothetical protein [Saccharothrix texasensis]|uniref:hypothetical protein n=1 Tax=Saccharothrix texasensis TaxID=103734 RepID=UPI001477431E|nr:hypothetical protein [Saccharothrix texasensis]